MSIKTKIRNNVFQKFRGIRELHLKTQNISSKTLHNKYNFHRSLLFQTIQKVLNEFLRTLL